MGREKSHSSICLLWMALLNVYRDWLGVNLFLKAFSGLQSLGDGPPLCAINTL
jgi:hypothetical protein